MVCVSVRVSVTVKRHMTTLIKENIPLEWIDYNSEVQPIILTVGHGGSQVDMALEK